MKKLNELQSYLTRLRGLMLTLIILCSIGSGNVWGAVNNGDLFERISAAPSASDEVMIVNSDETVAMSTTQNSNNRGQTSITTSSNQYIYASTDNVQVLTVKVDGTYYGFHTSGGSTGGFLQQPSNNNYLKTTTSAYSTALADATKWSLSVSSSVFTIRSKRNTAYYLQHNSGSSIFSSYKNTQNNPYIYKKVMSAPTAVAASDITSSGATITITDATNVNNYELYYSKSSTAPTAGTTATTTITSGKSKAITGLDANTTYYLWARAFSTSPARKTGWVALTGTTFKTLASGCSYKVNITAGTPESGGSFTLDKTGNQDCCSALTVTVSSITAPSGKRFSAITQSGIASGVTIDNNAKTVTYAANSSGASTINVTFEAIPTHDIHFNTGGLVAIADATGIQEGATYNISQTPAASLSDDCEYATFVGWTTESSTYVHGTSPLYTTSITMSTSDITLYAVYSKTSGGSTPTAYTAGDLGEFVIAAYNTSDSKWYALPQNPTLSSGKVTGVEITVSESNSVYYVTPTNATGYTWTIQTNTNGSCSQSLYDADNSKSIYHSNGGTSGTNLSYGTNTGYGWNIASETNGLTFQGVGISSNTCTTNSRGMLMQGTTFGGYALSNEDASGYYRIQVLPIVTPGTTTYSLEPNCNAPKITVNKTSIDFEDKKVGGSYTATFTVSGENLTGAINLAVSGAQAGRYSVSPATLSPTAGIVAETTITVTFAPTHSADHRAQVDITSDGATAKTVSLHAISKWEVTWKNDGAVYATTLVQGGHKPTFPATPTSCDTEESNVFYGWTDAEWPGKIDNVSAKTIHKSNATMPNASNNTTIYYAVFVKRTGSVDDYTDNLTRTTTGVSGTTYTAWSGKTGSSGAVYAGNSAGGNDAIQLRSDNSNSGIITTTSGGKAKKVTVLWESHTASGRTIDIYGKNTAYSGATDLYGDGDKGTKIGSIVYGTSTELTIDDDYAYIGIRSNSGALYLTSISIDWQDGEYSYSKYMTNCCDYHITVATPTKTGTGSGTVVFASGGNTVAAGSDVPTCAGTTTITATVTPNPGHQCDAVSFSGGSVSVSPTIPSPFVPFDNAGATTYTLTFAGNTNATLSTAVTFTVLQDKYYDYMHDNATETHNGNYGTAPTLSSSTPGAGCAGEHYKFIGWIPESDMNMETGVPTTTAHMVTGGQTGMYATGTNYYAIWAEEVTP